MYQILINLSLIIFMHAVDNVVKLEVFVPLIVSLKLAAL